MEVRLKRELRYSSFREAVWAVRQIIVDRGLAGKVTIIEDWKSFLAFETADQNGFVAVLDDRFINGSYGHVMEPVS